MAFHRAETRRNPGRLRPARTRPRRRVFEPLEPRRMLDAGPLVISEFMAANAETLADEDGDSSDWIEIHNPSNTTLDLDGWYLTDDPDNLNRWEFPPVILETGGYLVVFASGKDRRSAAAGPLHTNFKLSAGGEDLLLVRPNGRTVAHAYRDYPPQFADISYGAAQDAASLVADGALLSYVVPNSGDAASAAPWTAVDFDDDSWTGGKPPSPVLITEVGTADLDFVEIQNVSANPVDTAGWVVAVNNATVGINAVHSVLWQLPERIAAEEVLYRTDDPQDNYWGEGINWRTTRYGWVLIIDDQGAVADFVVWGYDADDLASFDVQVNGQNVSVGNAWIGLPAERNDHRSKTLQRHGNADRNGADDVAFVEPESMGVANPAMVLPFPGGPTSGIGFGANGFGDIIRTDVEDAMRGVNASLWTRFQFELDDPAKLESLQLRMKYNDGYVAYLNGQEVARRNAPAAPQWDSAATASRSSAESLLFEGISLDGHLDALRPGQNVLAVRGLNADAAGAEFLILPELVGLFDSDMVVEGYYAVATPAAANDGDAVVTGPVISDVTTLPLRPAADEDLLVTAAVASQRSDVAQVTLRYRVMYGDEVDVAMRDDGQDADAVAADGVYTAVIPATAYASGQMVRWLVTATDTAAGQWRSPAFLAPADSPEYFGTVVADPSADSQIPAFDWFVERSSAADTSRGTQASVFYGGEFYDNLSVRIRGDTGRNWPKKLYKFDFNTGDHFRFDGELPRVDEINLNSTYTDKSYVRTFLAYDTYRDSGAAASIAFPLRVHRNGQFFSVAQFVEQPDKDLLSRNGLDPDGALYKASANGIRGSANSGFEKRTRRSESHSDMQNLINGLARSGDALSDYIFDNVNLPATINYMAASALIQNIDRTVKNYYLYRDTGGTGEWQMLPWDVDLSFGPDALNTDVVDATDDTPPDNASHPFMGGSQIPYHGLWNSLLDAVFKTPRAREMFLRRLRTLMDQFLGTEYYENRIDELVGQLADDVAQDRARWGGSAHFGGRNYTFQQATDLIKNEFLIPRRTHLFFNHNINNPQFPKNAGIPNAQPANPGVQFGTIEYNPPSGNQDQEYIELLNREATAVDLSGWRLGGGVAATFQPGTVIPAGDKLYVAPDVTAFRGRPTGPRGGMGLLVQSYDGHLSSFGETITLTAPDGQVVAETTYEGDPSLPQRFLRITEINYHPHQADPAAGEADVEPDLFEFVELLNTSTTAALDLTGVRFSDGIDFDFTGSAVTSLNPGDRVLLVRNLAAFRSRYGSDLPVAGQYGGGLKNSGESVKLDDADGNTIAQFAYDDEGPWPGRGDGRGSSLEVVDVARDYGDPQNWRSSSEFGGSPGTAGYGPRRDVLVNEVLSRSAPPQVDWIELVNTNEGPIDVGGWYLSDSWGWPDNDENGNYKKYRIPDGTTIAAGGYLVFDETHFNPSAGVDPANHANDFALSGVHGDDVWLLATDALGNLTYFVDHVDFGAAADGESLGRWPDALGRLAPMTAPTPGQPNSGPRVGPVVMSELQYNAGDLLAAADLEFIEIYNPTDATVDLTEWRLRGGVDFDFATGARLAARATLVLLPFDPQDAAETDRWTTFCTHYGLDPNVTDGFVGGYLGQLSNGGETVRLQRADEPPPGTEVIPRLLEDEVAYTDAAPWPTDADGSGNSLTRLGPLLWGNDPSSWSAAAATPGVVPLPAEVTGRYVFYNNSAFDRTAAGQTDDDAIAPDKEALLPGDTASFANYTSYVRGINGILIDVVGLPETAELDLSADFAFRVGNDDAPAHWTDAPVPQSLVVSRGGGADGSDRLVLVWDDYAVINRWLQVTVRSTARTGLAADDIFYFGNAIGEAGNSTLNAAVNATDEIAARNAEHGPTNLATVDDPYDYNRDRLVNTTDRSIARSNHTGPAEAVRLITAPRVDAVMGQSKHEF